MPDEHSTAIRIAGEQPPVPVGTAVNLSDPNGHGIYSMLYAPPSTYRRRGRSATPAVKRGAFSRVSLLAAVAGPTARPIVARGEPAVSQALSSSAVA
jgi:hypothetical protein